MDKLMTKEEAVALWVNSFNAIPCQLIQRAVQNNPDDWVELTLPVVGDTVYSFKHGVTGTVEEIDYVEGLITLDLGDYYDTVAIDDVEIQYESMFPMWGTLWSFGDVLDEEWARYNIDEISKAGFRVFEDSYDGTIYLGIDGAGYDFYKHHWEPLYDARGLKWHSEVREPVKAS